MLLVKAYPSYTVMVDEKTLANEQPDLIVIFRGNMYDGRTFKNLDGGRNMYGYVLSDYKENLAEIETAVARLKDGYTPAPIPTPVPPEPAPAPRDDFASRLENIMIQVLAEQSVDKVMNQAKPLLDKYIRETYGAIPKTFKVETPTETRKVDGVTHEKFEQVLNLVNMDIPVFLSGPAGTGKNVICKQVAESLGLDFYFTNAVTQEYKLTGFIDANGNYQETQFYKAFKNGGLFFLDEMDASIPEVLIVLNAAIANRYFDFPNGKIDANPNFRVIAAGNTFGTGADVEYNGRYQLDAASLDRFALIEIDYSPAIENAVTDGDTEIIDFAHAVRRAAKDCGMHCLCTYRAMERIKKLSSLKGFTTSDVLEIALYKGLGVDDRTVLKNKMIENGCSNKYVKATA